MPSFSAHVPGSGLRAALVCERPEIIARLAESGLKGRGGAGFPTSVKWNLAGAAQAERKFIVCNADEGEPGTFKDRAILMAYPDLVFEGMAIAGKAIGAREGILFLRGEYAYLRGGLEQALARLRERGLLGPDLLGSGLAFDVRIFMGAGAYICGEETALIECLEGFRGEPRNRPPFPVDNGYLGFPTVVNNVETLCWAACILARGAAWFRSAGTGKSTGPKLFSVSGDCARPGVYELPMGITVAQLLREVGGEGAKAVQIGGASGQCVPTRDFERALAFEDIPTGGSVIVLGPGRDLLEVVGNFLEFFVDESCGQCTPCRLGNRKLLEGVGRLRAGTCSMAYLHELRGLGETLQLASKCGLGQTSPNAFLSVLEHFPEEVLGRTARPT